MSMREELEKQGYKTYENDEIEVFRNPGICQHAGKCARGIPAVFDPKRRPWIDLSQASAKAIAAVIDQCPSGALRYELKDPVSVVFEEDAHRSAAYIDGEQLGECEFSPSKTTWIISHTGVEPAYEGRGIARRLVEKVIEEARTRKVKIMPLCPYARKMMVGNEEYNDML